MIPGVNFQPGAQSYGQQDGQRRPSGGGSQQGVQEAIKVLSLRLPKVVGARSVAPAPLLNSEGSGGSPHVDSIVESVLSRMFGSQRGAAPSAPMMDPSAAGGGQSPSTPDYRTIAADAFGGGGQTSPPTFTGVPTQTPTVTQTPPTLPWTPPPTTPQIIVTPTHPTGDFTVGPDGRPVGPVPGSIIEPAPDLRQHFDWLQHYPSPSQDVPLI